MTTPDRTRVTVEIYGTSYKLVGSSADYMKQVANLVDERMSAISKSHSRLDTPRIAVLAAVHMAEQSLQTEEIRNELKMLTGERTELRKEINRLNAIQSEHQNELQLRDQSLNEVRQQKQEAEQALQKLASEKQAEISG